MHATNEQRQLLSEQIEASEHGGGAVDPLVRGLAEKGGEKRGIDSTRVQHVNDATK